MSIFRRFLNLWRQDSLHNEFDDELRFHLQMRTDANLRAGMSREDAEREARQHMGSLVSAGEAMREARLMSWLDTLSRDLRHGARLLLRQPILASLAVLTLALGIGANATIFSLLNAALLKPLPFPESDRLVAIVDGFRADNAIGIPPTVPELLDVRQQSRSLEGLSFYDTRDFQINGGSEPERVFAARVEASFLSLLGVRPAYGRLFQADENLPGNDRVVILSDSLWRRNFGGDPNVIGRQIILNGVAAAVIGVLPPEFSFDYQSAERIEMYVPFLMNTTYTSRDAPFVNVRRVSAIARLKPGYRVESAAAELQTISQNLANQYPSIYRRGSDSQDTGFFMTATPLHQALTGSNRDALALLLAAVGLVLLIACVNTAQFLISRSLDRQAEVAVRNAIGAGRGRLIAQFLTEAMMLGAVGGALGLLLVFWLNKALLAILPARVPLALIGQLRIDTTVLGFTIALTLVTTLLSGLVPALRFGRHDPVQFMAGRGFVPVRARGRQILIAVEVGLSALLLVVAGLLLASLHKLQNAPSGYSAERITVMQLRMASDRSLAARPRFLEQISAIPGVDSVALADWPIPFGSNTDFAIEGEANDAATLSRQLASYRMVSPEYFSTLRIPLREGRAFTNEDIIGRTAVAIINDEMARRFWPGQSPLGRRVRAGPGPRNAVLTIVGVAGDVRPVLQTSPTPQIYVPNFQQTEPNQTLLVRSATTAAVSPETVKKAIQSVVPEQPVFNIRPLTEIVAQSFADQTAIAFILGSFAFLALFMSVTGVFTVVTYLTSRRAKEIAIRRAVGARSRNVLALLAGQTLLWTVLGLVLGLAGAVAASTALRATLRGLVRMDPLTLGFVAGLYLLIVAAAICWPAAKALRADPGSILRVD
jgi:putative ABC transport system permease protein